MKAQTAASSWAVPTMSMVTFLVGLAALVVGAGGAIIALRTALATGNIVLAQLLLLVPLAGWGYGLRFVRWHLLIRRAVPALGLWPSFRAQAIGFGLSVTPGRIGEIWKLYLVQRATNEPAALGAGAMLIERATDLIGFTTLVVVASTQVSGSIVHLPIVSALAVAGVIVVLLAARWFVGRRQHLTRGPSLLRQLLAGGNAVMRPVPVTLALLALIFGRAGDGLLLWGVMVALGHPVSPAFAIFAFATSGLIGGVSLLPGGIGAAEGTMVAVLATGGVPAATGLLAALITRALILWIWVALGILLFAQDQLGRGLNVRSSQ